MNKREAIRSTKEQADERKRLRALTGQIGWDSQRLGTRYNTGRRGPNNKSVRKQIKAIRQRLLTCGAQEVSK